jgi:hypothetical protein
MDPKTDKVAGLLGKMNLTDLEKRSIKIGGTSGEGGFNLKEGSPGGGEGTD